MQGYYKNPEATAATLKKHEDGSLWVHSGDVGYMTEEGMVYVVDRLKRAINVDGQRVFPSTIESILLKNEAVNKCAVVGDKTGKLFAHVVLCSGYIPDTVRSELARMCEAELPKYELPTEYVFRAALPLTPVGKVDFRALENEAK